MCQFVKVSTDRPTGSDPVSYYVHSNQGKPIMRHYTKAQVVEQFRYNWKVATMQDPSIKGDKIRKRIAFGDFTDMLASVVKLVSNSARHGQTLSDGETYVM